jgi:hypothetical protein
MYKTAFLKVLTDYKLLLKSVVFSLMFLFLFLYFANFSQFNQILFLNISFPAKIITLLELVLESFKVIPFFTSLLYIIWVVLLFIFNAVFLYLWKQKSLLSVSGTTHSGKLAFISGVFSYLGFGCIACGQSILLSIFTLFFTVTTSFLHNVVNIILIIGIGLLIYSTKKDLKQIYLGNQCEI